MRNPPVDPSPGARWVFTERGPDAATAKVRVCPSQDIARERASQRRSHSSVPDEPYLRGGRSPLR
jgi:hypothetical protein